MKIRLLRKIQKQILTEPDRFWMGQWHCGTSHCLGGWAQTLLGLKEKCDGFYNEKYLQAHFGLTETQAGRLFWTIGWPKKFRNLYLNAANRPQQAVVASARIDHFIKTKGKK